MLRCGFPGRRVGILGALIAAATTMSAQGPVRSTSSPAPSGIRFTDITKAAGLKFAHSTGASGHNYFAESIGGGAAFLDYDADGLLDVFLIGGGALPGYRGAPPKGDTLFRNRGDGTFNDVSSAAGLGAKSYSLGVVAGDYDNDGHTDLYITTVQRNTLYHNDGHGHFVDVTASAGVAAPAISTGAAFLDYDRDGRLDLFVSRYVDYTIEKDRGCVFMGQHRPEIAQAQAGKTGAPVFCAPLDYPATVNRLFRNLGNGKFSDVTRTSGVGTGQGRGLGIAVSDYNEDGWPDVFVASDTLPNLLFVNQRNGTFKEDAVRAAVARYVTGAALAGMGADAADFNNDGHADLLVTNFENEPTALYIGRGDGTFFDGSVTTTLFEMSRYFVKWGCRLLDLDGDGLKDIFVVHSHVDPLGTLRPLNFPDALWKGKGFAQEAQIYLNQRGSRFVNASSTAGPFFRERHVARGAAFGDFDNDGDWDAIVHNVNAPAVLLRNDEASHRWARLELEGDACNRDALGSRVRVTTGALVQTDYIRSAGSYLSDHDRRPLFALPGTAPATAEIRWPCGAVQTVTLTAGRTQHVKEAACLLRKSR